MWSRRHEQCIECGTREKPHRGSGLCKTCYERLMSHRHKNPVSKRGTATQKLTEEYLTNEYVRNRKSLQDIAAECGCSRAYVHRMMRLHGIPARDRSEARSLALERGKVSAPRTDSNGRQYTVTLRKTTVNEDFFSSWSPEMAYVLGVIYTDGCLYKVNKQGGTGQLSIGQKEPELLNKVCALMDCDTKLRYSREREYPTGKAGAIWTMSISNQKIYADLLQLGLTPRKSRTIVFPAVPAEYARHFIRGCWDGDGSVFAVKESNTIVAHFVSGSFKFAEGMLAELEKAGLPKRRVYKTRGNKPCYSFRFHATQCEMLYHFLYDGVPSGQYLERKHSLFKRYRNLSIEMRHFFVGV